MRNTDKRDIYVEGQEGQADSPGELRAKFQIEDVINEIGETGASGPNLGGPVSATPSRESSTARRRAAASLARSQISPVVSKMGASLAKKLEKMDPDIDILDMCDKHIEELPSNIDRFRNLKRFNVSNNLLKDIPTEIGELKKLEVFKATNNKIREVPTELVTLLALQELNLSVNKIKTLPRGFGGWPNIVILDLSYNELEELSPQIGLLRTLRELFLSFNNLKSLPAEIGSCTALQKLIVANNAITTLPSELGQLNALKRLDLTGNKLALLPPSVVTIESIEKLEVGNNPPLNKAITAAAKRGNDELLRYLRSNEYAALWVDEKEKEEKKD